MMKKIFYRSDNASIDGQKTIFQHTTKQKYLVSFDF